MTAFAPPPLPALRIAGLRRRYGPIVALDGIDLEVRTGEMLTLLGPSGCGKTTILRLVAGLENPDAGTIEIAGRRVAGPGGAVPPERRRVGMVFQDHALFPHLSVADNVGYGIRNDPDRAVRVQELLDLVSLPGAAHRMPHELSGGMQQRVAIARALTYAPPFLLMDEPFGALDLITRDRMATELLRIWASTPGTTVLFITHSIPEAILLSDRVVVLSARPGRVLRTVDIELPRPRSERVRESSEFYAYENQLRHLLQAEHEL
jgi:ABC-type nitrate/sulfonate/bicarbonate transport system ATPase subunit